MKWRGECFVYLTQIMNRRVVLGAKAAGVSGKKLEEKVSTLLVKGWRKGMQVDGTIKHVYFFLFWIHDLFCQDCFSNRAI